MSAVDTIYQLVQDDVKRPDKQGIIWRRIHRSILKMHNKDFWYKDLIEQIYQFDVDSTAAGNQNNVTGANSLFMNFFGGGNATLNVQQLDTTRLIRYRKVDYIRKWMTVSPYGTAILDPITGRQGTVAGGDLVEVSPKFMDDGYGYDRQDTFYGSGTDININSSTPLSQVYIGYLSNPKVNLGCTTLEQFQDYESWIADNYMALIACDVKRFLFADIGKLEAELKGAQMEYQEELIAFLTSAVNLSTRKG
jgi:hypothetical protein